MEKLPLCRICLAENVRMYVVVNRDLHRLYEKLTDTPFVTKDHRPILACFFCCTKLKQCYKLLRQCLKAEELFIQRMNEDFEPDPLIKQKHLEFFNGFIKSPILHMSIVEESQTEDIAIKEELPDVCEGLQGIIEPKDKRQSDELEIDVDDNCLDVADIIASHHSESDIEVDVETLKTEEQEVYRKKRKARGTKLEIDVDDNCLDVADIASHHSESDIEVDVETLKTEEQEVYRKKRKARGTKVGSDLSLPAVVESMVGSEESWDAVVSFCETVMSQKEAAEREREISSAHPARSRRTGRRQRADNALFQPP